MFEVKRDMVFRVKSPDNTRTTMRILARTDAGYDTIVSTESEYRSREYRQVMSDALMESCLRTGYITLIPASSAKSA